MLIVYIDVLIYYIKLYTKIFCTFPILTTVKTPNGDSVILYTNNIVYAHIAQSTTRHLSRVMRVHIIYIYTNAHIITLTQ